MYQILYHPLEIWSHGEGVSLLSLVLFLRANDAEASQLTARFYCKHTATATGPAVKLLISVAIEAKL